MIILKIMIKKILKIINLIIPVINFQIKAIKQIKQVNLKKQINQNLKNLIQKIHLNQNRNDQIY